MDLKRDLVRAIELNESVLDLDHDIKGIHLNIICEIRARLLEGNKLPAADHSLLSLSTEESKSVQ